MFLIRTRSRYRAGLSHTGVVVITTSGRGSGKPNSASVTFQLPMRGRSTALAVEEADLVVPLRCVLCLFFSSGCVVHAVRDTGYNNLKLVCLCEECGCIMGRGRKNQLLRSISGVGRAHAVARFMDSISQDGPHTPRPYAMHSHRIPETVTCPPLSHSGDPHVSCLAFLGP